MAQVVGDPHRVDYCLRRTVTFRHKVIDWAVYHAKGWEDWQTFRIGLKNTTLEERLQLLKDWDRTHPEVQDLVRVYNYVNAVLRGGMSSPELDLYADELKGRYWKSEPDIHIGDSGKVRYG